MNSKWIIFALVVSIFAANIGCASEGDTKSMKRYVITDYGAVSDSNTVNTQSIQATIDKCAANGGGTVVIPAVIMSCVRSLASRGRSMCANAVVVHEAAETSLCLPGSKSKWLMPKMRKAESSGRVAPSCLLLKGEL